MDHKPAVNTPADSQTYARKKLYYPIPFADRSLECPAEYGRLRATCPVAPVQMLYGGEAFLLTRYTDVFQTLANPHCRVLRPEDGDVPRQERVFFDNFLNMADDTRHSRIRRLVAQVFTVQHAKRLSPKVVALTNALIDEMERKGAPADLHKDYAIKTAMAVIGYLLGIPAEDEPLFLAWGHELTTVTAPTEKKQETLRHMMAYLTPIIERERDQPGDTVIGTLVKAWGQGEEILKLEELYMLAWALILAGFETISTTLSGSAFIFLQRPDLLAQLRERVDNPERMAVAIEEILRILPVAQGVTRIIRQEITPSGNPIPKGEVVVASLLSANYDEEIFPQAEEIDFDRSMKRPILTFGRGLHTCIGQHIARLELQTMWNTLLKRWPTVHLAVDPMTVPWRPVSLGAPCPTSLPVRWD